MSNEKFETHGTFAYSNAGGFEVMLSKCGEFAKLRNAYGSDVQETQVTEWLPIEYQYDMGGESFDECNLVIDPHGFNIPLDEVMRVNL